jgi:hypothetical protein
MTVSSNTGLVVGATIQGTGITAGTKITAISGTTVTMSANATAGGAQNLIFSSVYGSTLTITLSASGDVATWQNVVNAGFGTLLGTKNLFFAGALTVEFGSIVAGARFDHENWTVECDTGGRFQFDSGLLAGEQRGGYDVAGSLLIKSAGPTFIFRSFNNASAGGSGLFKNTGGLLTQGGTFRMHNPRFVLRSGTANTAFAFVSVRDNMDVENLILDYSEATGTNASIGIGYGTLLNPKIVFANSGLGRPNATAIGNIIGLQFLGLFTDNPGAKFAIPNNYVMEGYAPQVTSSQNIGGFQDNTTETFANINLTSPGWGLNDLKTRYLRYGGPNEIRFPRLVTFEFNDSTGANLTGATLFIKSGATTVVNAVQAGDYSANTQALVLNWAASVASYRVANTITDTISQVAQIRKYGYVEQSTSYSLNTASYSQPFFMLTDTALAGISEAAAAAITTAGINWTTKTITPTADLTYDQINARIAYELAQTTNSAQVNPRTVVGDRLTLATGWTLVVNTGRTISAGTAITFLSVPTVTLNGTGRITAIYANSSGTSTALELRNIKPGASYIAMNNATKATILFGTNGTASAADYPIYFPPGSAGLQVYVARKGHGDFIDFEVITLVAGAMWYSFVDIPDEGVVETNKATVLAYTTLETNRKIYEYVSAYQTTEEGIKLGNLVTRAGPLLNWSAPYSAKLKKDAPAVWAKSGNLFTIKATSLDSDAFTTHILVPPATMTADTDEIISTNIEDANGDSSLTVRGGDNLGYKLWKVPASLAVDGDPTTGTLLATVDRNDVYRFIGITGFDIIGVDQSSGVKRRTSMAKGIYSQTFYVGDEIQLADEAPQLIENNEKLAVLQVLTTDMQEQIEALQALVNSLPDDILAKPVETGATVAESLRLHNAVLGGKVSGAGSGIETFRDLADTKDRLVSTVDNAGNRSAEVADLT